MVLFYSGRISLNEAVDIVLSVVSTKLTDDWIKIADAFGLTWADFLNHKMTNPEKENHRIFHMFDVAKGKNNAENLVLSTVLIYILWV